MTDDDYWEDEWQWDEQLWNDGYAEFWSGRGMDFPTSRVALLAECRWGPVIYPDYVESRLWDQPSCPIYGARDKKKRAYVWSKMPRKLEIWRTKRRLGWEGH